MIFRPELIAAILAGRKTQTRRPAQPDVPCRYRPRHRYSVQPGRGQHGIATIHITSVEQQLLAAITDTDARAEGFPSREDFLAYWHSLYGHVDPTQPVWTIAFRLESQTVTDPPRLLGRSGGYTSLHRLAIAGDDPGEAIPADEQDWMTWRAQHAAAEADRLRAEQDELEHQIDRLLDQARAQGVSVTDDVFVIRQRLERIQRKLRTHAA